jgi:hypothetical protein
LLKINNYEKNYRIRISRIRNLLDMEVSETKV